MSDQDTRWHQRFQNYLKAFSQLDEAVALMQERALSKLEKQGVIQAFEYTYELGWSLLRDYLRWQGASHLTGSRDTIREAFSAGLIQDGERWMAMLQDRHRTSHTYNEETAEAILSAIRNAYHPVFKELGDTMSDESRRHGFSQR